MPRVDLSQIRKQQGSRAHGQQPASCGGAREAVSAQDRLSGQSQEQRACSSTH